MAKKIDEDLRGRIQRGDALTAEDLKKLQQAIAPKLGRPKRDALKTVRDEFGRAAEFAMARTSGQSYDDARKTAANNKATSVSSVTRSFTWLKVTLGIDRAELENAFRTDKDLADRITRGGLNALSPKEILLSGIVSAGIGALESEFSDEERAVIFLEGSQSGLIAETLDRTVESLQELARIATASSLPYPAETADEFAALIRIVAEPIAQGIALRIRGSIN